MKTSKKYTREIKEQFGYLATWLPSTPLALGDIGILRNNQFTKISNLSDFGIQFEVEPDETKSDIEHSSKGAVSITTKASGTIAFVTSTHRAGTSLGYSQAPVVVACNPSFKQGAGDAYKKYTIAQYEGVWVDLVAVKNELASMEDGWGGSPTIIGSPQGISSELTPEQVLAVVEKHLKKKV